MRLRALLRLSLALLALGGGTAAAEGLDGRIGLYFQSYDLWGDSGTRQRTPSLALDLEGGHRGAIGRQRIVAWDARLGYLWSKQTDNGRLVQSSDGLRYSGVLRFLDQPTTPITLSLLASQLNQGFVYSDDSAGDRLARTLGATLVLKSRRLPTTSLAYRRLDVEEHLLGLPDHQKTSDLFSGDMTFGDESHWVQLRYDGELSSGTWEIDNFDQHDLRAYARSQFSPGWEFAVSDAFSKRTPTEGSPVFGFARESNAFTASLIHGLHGDRTAVYYRNLMTSMVSSAMTLNTRVQGLNGFSDVQLGSKELFLRAIADASQASVTNSGITTDTLGALLGADFWRRRAWVEQLELHGGPLVGYNVPDVGDSYFGHGGVLGAQLTPLPVWRTLSASGTYDFAYENALRATKAWTLRHTARLQLDGRLSPDAWIGPATWTAILGWNAVQTHGGPLGSGASRELRLDTRLDFRRHSLLLDAVASSGVAPGTTLDGVGLFVPFPYSIHRRSVSAGVRGRPWSELSWELRARYLQSVSPGAPSLDTVEGLATLTYRIAALDLSLIERLSSTEAVAGGRALTNRIELRVSRYFGSRY